MAGLYDLIPGLREAEENYRQQQAEAFALIEPKICGLIEVRPFTPLMFIHLDGIDSPFFRRAGKLPDEVDMSIMLWRISTLYVPGDDDLRRFFIGNLVMLEVEQLQADLFAYIGRSWAGMPQWPGSTGGSAGVGQWPARLVDMFGSEYGWNEDYVLNLPFRRLWQYANRVLERRNPKYREQSAAALKLRADWLAAQNAGAAALAKN